MKNWVNNFTNGANYKHADCNGDGIVDDGDTVAIARNYSKSHAKKFRESHGKNTDPTLKIEIQNDSLKAGDSLTAYIVLGENSLPTENVYGLAMSISYNQDYFKLIPGINYDGCWLGSKGNNLLTYTHNSNELDQALTRIDHTNKSGYGRLAEIKLILKDNVPKDIKKLKLEISDYYMISFNEKEIDVNLESDEVKIYHKTNGINYISYYLTDLKAYPNPFSNNTMVEYTLQKVANVKLTLFDMTGKMHELMQVSKQAIGNHLYTINSSDNNLKSGIYLLKLEVDGVPAYKKIVKVN